MDVIPVSAAGSGSVSDEGEFALIQRIVARLPDSPELLVGPGDDGAVIAAPDGRVVASTDVMVEGRHFRQDWSSAYDVGRKAAAANLADIVAMGARPTALLVGFGCPADLPVAWAEGFADGLRDEAALVGASIAGGDVVASEAITVAVTALGDLEGRAPLLRSGAKPGDQVVLIGEPGRAAAGLAALAAGKLTSPFTAAHRRPEPRYDAALSLARHGRATAMIDISDGLVADLRHIAVASNVRIDLHPDRVPVAAGLETAAAELGLPSAFAWLTEGGDDHCFAATVPAGDDDLPVIGTVAGLEVGEAPAIRFVDPRGAGSTESEPRSGRGGHEHFRS